MPASISSLLVLWLALLPSGVMAKSGHSVGPELASMSRPSPTSLALDEMATIHARPLDQGCSWNISEADTEEEETGDGEGDGMVADCHWSTLRIESSGQALMTRLARVATPTPIRTQILRC